MSGHGAAHGAVTIINATATGTGCALAIDAPTLATWAWGGEDLDWKGTTDAVLASAILDHLGTRLGRDDGATIDCAATFPPSRGLKTSSSAALAMVRAGLDAVKRGLPEADILDICIGAAQDAGITLTGAYDDLIATARGGCHLTDNHARRIVASVPVPRWHVAVWVPDASIRKAGLVELDLAPVRADVEAAIQTLRRRDIPGALTANGAAYHRLYKEAGLPVDDTPTKVALEAGALGAGLSGTGPAVAALFEAKTELSPVDGGRWTWSRSVS